jgi:(R,R)-butanediol dehydrogenase/meso-butanediol dehydrogenase/diacetyl reductase
MRAAVYKGKQRLEVEEVPTPTPGPGQVLLKIKYCAICGTDVHAFLYDIPAPDTVMGHEYCGTIAEVGPGVTRWKEGDRVIGDGGTPPPGVDKPLRVEPRYNYRTMGFASGRQRAYAEYTLQEEWEPRSIPDAVSDEAAALCEPCSVAVRAVRRSRLGVGDAVGIIGAGPIGMLCLQVAKAAGAGSVFVAEMAPARIEAARRLGADEVINAAEEDTVSRMVELTDGRGPAVVFDCAGIRNTLDQALNAVRRAGQVVLVAVPWEPMPLLPVEWMAREITLDMTFGGDPEDWKTALDLIAAGKVTMEPLLSGTSFVPMDEIQSAFEALTKPSTQLQMVVKP